MKTLFFGIVALLVMAGGVGAEIVPLEECTDLFYGTLEELEQLAYHEEVEIEYDVNGGIYKVIFYGKNRSRSDTYIYNDYGQITVWISDCYICGDFPSVVQNITGSGYGYIDENGTHVRYGHFPRDVITNKSINIAPPSTPNPLEVELNLTKQELADVNAGLVNINTTVSEHEDRISWLETMVNRILDWINDNFSIDLRAS